MTESTKDMNIAMIGYSAPFSGDLLPKKRDNRNANAGRRGISANIYASIITTS